MRSPQAPPTGRCLPREGLESVRHGIRHNNGRSGRRGDRGESRSRSPFELPRSSPALAEPATPSVFWGVLALTGGDHPWMTLWYDESPVFRVSKTFTAIRTADQAARAAALPNVSSKGR